LLKYLKAIAMYVRDSDIWFLCSYIIENLFIKRVFFICIIEKVYCTVKYFFNKFNKFLLIACNILAPIVKILLTIRRDQLHLSLYSIVQQ
jgi:hypothetical protein